MSDLIAARLLARHSIAQDTVAFEFERPSDFHFEAGQFLSVVLPDFIPDEDSEDDGERMLSICSAPHDERLVVAVRMRDTPFKQHLARAIAGADGAHVHLSPAMGELVLPREAPADVVMIAGGIGITPFYSMLRDLAHRQARGETVPSVTLLYGNRHRAAAVWFDELNTLAEQHAFLRVVHVLAEADSPTVEHGRWAVRHGLITAQTVRETVPEYTRQHHYVVGPTAMVAAMQDCLDDCGVPPDQVFLEFFAGY